MRLAARFSLTVMALMGSAASVSAQPAAPNPAPPPPPEAPPTEPATAPPVSSAPPAAPVAPPASSAQPPTPAPSVVQAPRGSYAAMAAQMAGERVTPVEGPLEQRLREQPLTFVLRMGFVVGGSGELESECEESGTATNFDAPSCSGGGGSESIDYDDEAGLALGADLLFRTTPKLRLGVGSLVVLDPKYKLKVGGYSADIESGTEISTFGVVEGVFPVGDNTGLFLRGDLGLTMLFAGNDHADSIDDFREGCRASSYEACDTNEGPFFGPMIGIGFGVIVQAGPVALRGELVGQYVAYPMWRTEVTGSGVTAKERTDARGTRSYIFAGLEF